MAVVKVETVRHYVLTLTEDEARVLQLLLVRGGADLGPETTKIQEHRDHLLAMGYRVGIRNANGGPVSAQDNDANLGLVGL